jgi:hypothetical protein
MSSTTLPDKLLINLKILSKIQKNGRITRSYDGIISLESDAVYKSVKRFVTSDSRKQAVSEINSIINETVLTLNNILSSKFMTKPFFGSDEFVKNCELLNLIVSELEQSKTGIEHLKFTYKNDQNTASQLDIIILKMNSTIKDVYQKLTYYHTYTNTLSPTYAHELTHNDNMQSSPNEQHTDTESVSHKEHSD